MLYEPSGQFTIQELPYVHIPFNMSLCHNDSGNNHHNNTNHTSNSLIDTCSVLPEVARHASNVTPGLISCTSSIVPNCNTIMCVVESSGERMRFTFLPCNHPPAVQVAVPRGNGSHLPSTVNFTAPHNTVNASIGGSPVPLYVNIRQRSSNLTMGAEVNTRSLTLNSVPNPNPPFSIL